MKRTDTIIVILGVICAALLYLLFIVWLGAREVICELRNEAIEQGHAEWVVTDTQGNTEFRWKYALPVAPEE